jgi:hypothetical protein
MTLPLYRLTRALLLKLSSALASCRLPVWKRGGKWQRRDCDGSVSDTASCVPVPTAVTASSAVVVAKSKIELRRERELDAALDRVRSKIIKQQRAWQRLFQQNVEQLLLNADSIPSEAELRSIVARAEVLTDLVLQKIEERKELRGEEDE